MRHPNKAGRRIAISLSKGRQAGMSLIEVLVAILVVALGIMTMVVMQVNSTKMTKTSEVRAMGALLVGDLADRMRANPAGFVNNNYANTESADAPEVYTECNTRSCEPEEMARQDRSEWLSGLRFALPNGTARISQIDQASGKNGVNVWLIWIDPEERGDANAPNASPNQCPTQLGITSAGGPIRCMYFRINV
jgi:type IV pilus assembly protein PilV